MAVDLDKIDKVDTNITVPSVDDKLMETEKDKWGIILNNAFNILNNNIKIYKEIILELANTQNSLDLSDILLRLKNLEIDRDSIESIVNNNNSEYIDVGLESRKLNLKGTQLEFNNNEINLDDIAFKSKNNTFKKAVNTEEHFSIEGEKIIDIENSNVNVGNPKNLINLISSEDIILLNGVEFKQIDVATETTNGTSKIATQTEVNNGLEDTKIVTSKKLKARLDSFLAGITSTYVKLTQLATENIAGIIKISTTAQVSAGTDNTTAVSPAKLKELFTSGSTKALNGYQKLPSGVIIQWGVVADGVTNVTFPVTFPTGCASLQITRGGGIVPGTTGSGGIGASVIISMSNTGFTADSVTQSGDDSMVYYLAIGY